MRIHPSSTLGVLALTVALLSCQPDEKPVVSREQAATRGVGFHGQSFTAPPRSVEDVVARFEEAMRSSPHQGAQPAAAAEDESEAPVPVAPEASARAIADTPPPAGMSDEEQIGFYRRRAGAAQRAGRVNQSLEDSRRAAALALSMNHRDVGFLHQFLALREWNVGRADAAFAAIDEGLKASRQTTHRLALHRERVVFNVLLGRRAAAARALEEMGREATPAIQSNSVYAPLYRARFEAARGAVANLNGRYREAEAAHRAAAEESLRMIEAAAAGRTPGVTPAGGAIVYGLDRSRALGSAASAQQSQGRHGEAEITERLALDESLQRFGPWSSHTLQRLSSFGQMVGNQGRLDDAEKILRLAGRVLDRNQAPAGSGLRLSTDQALANTLVLKREYREARAIYDRMHAQMREDATQRARFLDRNLFYGLALMETGSAPGALVVLDTLTDNLNQLGRGNYQRAAVARALRAEALSRTGNPGAAEAEFRGAIPLLLSSSGGAGDDDVTARERMRRVGLDYAIDFFGRRGGADAVSMLPAADSVGSLGVQSAIQALANRNADLDPAMRDLVREQQDTGFLIGVLERQAVDLLSRRSASAAAEARALQDEIAELGQRRQRTQAELVRRTPQLQRLERNAGLDIARLGASLRQREAAVAIYTSERMTHVWSIAHGGAVTHHAAPIGIAAMSERVAGLRRALDVDGAISTLQDIRPFDVAQANRLYAELIAPVRASWGDAETVIVSVSGPLSSLPLGVLVTRPVARPAPNPAQAFFAEYRGVPFLAREVAIAHVPSLSSFLVLRDLRASTANRRAFLAFADPVFAPGAAPRQDGGVVVRRAAFRSGTRGSATIADLPSLPDTAEEARAIAAVLGASPDRDLFLGERANERSVRSLDMRDWRIVMFATHGLLAGDLDGLSEPALALARSGDGADDGLLTVGKIMTLRLDADWVVLSACNTAGPQGAGGEALSGVSRAFLYAGARSLLVTHWPVETTAARNFTVALFRRQAAGDSSRGAAMRAVSEDMIARLGATDAASGRTLFSYAHPLFWAPFAFIGDPG